VVRSEFWDAAIDAEVIRWEVESKSALRDSNRIVRDVWMNDEMGDKRAQRRCFEVLSPLLVEGCGST